MPETYYMSRTWFICISLCWLKLYLQAKYEFLCDAHESGGYYTGKDEQAAVDVYRHQSSTHIHWSCRNQIDGNAHNYLKNNEREQHITPKEL